MIGSEKALLISEVGWRGIKDLSSALLKNGLSVDIIIKGRVDREVLDIITKPEGLTIYAIPRIFFSMYLFFCFLWHKAMGDLTDVFVTKVQRASWARRFGFDAKLLIETEKGYEIRNNRDK